MDKLLIPLSIVLAGIIIAASIVYSNGKISLESPILNLRTGAKTEASRQATQFNECLDSKKYLNRVQADVATAQQNNINGTPTVLVNGRKAPNPLDYASLKALIETELSATAAAQKKSVKEPILNVGAGTNPLMGNASAPVKIVEFADYQCPYCGMFKNQIESRLKLEYIDTGKASFDFRDFAFLGRESFDAALAARCASDQGEFWPYHDKIFDNQNGENQGAFSPENLKRFAVDLGLK